MQKLMLAVCLLVSTAVHADDSAIVGQYTHEFASKNDVVWVVRMAGKRMQLVTKDPDTILPVVLLTQQERKDLWEALAFEASPTTHLQSTCVGASNEYICYVPKAARAGIRVLKNRESNFFHYDKMGGIMEIQKLSAKK